MSIRFQSDFNQVLDFILISTNIQLDPNKFKKPGDLHLEFFMQGAQTVFVKPEYLQKGGHWDCSGNGFFPVCTHRVIKKCM